MSFNKIPFDLGKILTELFAVEANEFNNLDDIINNFLSLINVYQAVGEDLDNIGDNYSLKRLLDEDDITYKARMILFISSSDIHSTLPLLKTVSFGILGDTYKKILEYPEYDFTSLIGQAYPGLLVLVDPTTGKSSTELEILIDQFKQEIQYFKPAGIPISVGYLAEFTEILLASEISLVLEGIQIDGYFTETILQSAPPSIDISNTFVIGRSIIEVNIIEQISNGGFESGQTVWTFVGGTQIHIFIFHSGTKSWQFGTVADYTSVYIEKTGYNINTTNITDFSFWGRKNSGGTVSYRIIFTYSDFSTSQQDFSVSSSFVWEKKTVTNIDSFKTLTEIKIACNSTTVGYIDDISLSISGDASDYIREIPLFIFEEKIQ